VGINLTLVGQAITFLIFVWFTMKFVWPPLVKAMQERQKTIADGLAAAVQGQQELAQAEEKIQGQLRETKQQAAAIIEKAYHRADQIIEEAKAQARVEGERMLDAAQEEIAQSTSRAREALRKEVVTLAMQGAERVLTRSIDPQMHNEMLQQLATDMKA
jgi:F-type H+-transporting ATPase subunit b